MSKILADSTELLSNDRVFISPSKEPTAPTNLLPKKWKKSRERSKFREIVSVLKFGPLAPLVYRKRQQSKAQEAGFPEPIILRPRCWPPPDTKEEAISNLSSTAIDTTTFKNDPTQAPSVKKKRMKMRCCGKLRLNH